MGKEALVCIQFSYRYSLTVAVSINNFSHFLEVREIMYLLTAGFVKFPINFNWDGER